MSGSLLAYSLLSCQYCNFYVLLKKVYGFIPKNSRAPSVPKYTKTRENESMINLHAVALSKEKKETRIELN